MKCYLKKKSVFVQRCIATCFLCILCVHLPANGLTKTLTKEEAEKAIVTLFQAHQKQLRERFDTQWAQKELRLGTYTMPFDYKVYGKAPSDGRSLYISMHGGGGTTAQANDEQWQNQKKLYKPTEGVYFVPRAPTDAWDMWHQEHMDAFIEHIIALAGIKEQVNPNKVYIMGYSAGGDGVYQLAPRLADLFAAAAMSAGHPNDAHIESLGNVPFGIYMGAQDSAYKRNAVAAEWGTRFDSLAQKYDGLYMHDVKLFEGLGHWMQLKDAVSIPWMAKFKRNPIPKTVIWIQDDVLRENFYWLSVKKYDTVKNAQIVAYYENNEVHIGQETTVDNFIIGLNDAMVNLDEDITVYRHGKQIFKGKVTRSLTHIQHDIAQMRDIGLVFPAKIFVKGDKAFPYRKW